MDPEVVIFTERPRKRFIAAIWFFNFSGALKFSAEPAMENRLRLNERESTDSFPSTRINADNSLNRGDGNDTITDFSGPGGDGDFVLLDELFDALGGFANAAARAAAVNLDNGSDQGVGGAAIDTVLTITGQADFSITFQDVTLTDPTGGALTVADLAFLGIDVGS